MQGATTNNFTPGMKLSTPLEHFAHVGSNVYYSIFFGVGNTYI